MTETLTYRNVDKTSWSRGPWDDEPDKEQWADPATGLPCLIKRNPHLGQLCGYVGTVLYDRTAKLAGATVG